MGPALAVSTKAKAKRARHKMAMEVFMVKVRLDECGSERGLLI